MYIVYLWVSGSDDFTRCDSLKKINPYFKNPASAGFFLNKSENYLERKMKLQIHDNLLIKNISQIIKNLVCSNLFNYYNNSLNPFKYYNAT
jgi:hypothetical protein